jgi:hypothetical protein
MFPSHLIDSISPNTPESQMVQPINIQPTACQTVLLRMKFDLRPSTCLPSCTTGLILALVPAVLMSLLLVIFALSAASRLHKDGADVELDSRNTVLKRGPLRVGRHKMSTSERWGAAGNTVTQYFVLHGWLWAQCEPVDAKHQPSEFWGALGNTVTQRQYPN